MKLIHYLKCITEMGPKFMVGLPISQCKEGSNVQFSNSIYYPDSSVPQDKNKMIVSGINDLREFFHESLDGRQCHVLNDTLHLSL